jgi:hypothetical protein
MSDGTSKHRPVDLAVDVEGETASVGFGLEDDLGGAAVHACEAEGSKCASGSRTPA